MDYNTAISKLEEDLELAVHSGDEKQIEAIKYQINYVKKHRFEWFHNGFYDHKTGKWHTMEPEVAEYLNTCGMSDEEIVAYVNSREEHTNPFPAGMDEIESDAVKELMI